MEIEFCKFLLNLMRALAKQVLRSTNHLANRTRKVTRFESNPTEGMPSVVDGEVGRVTAL
jgi:hypothetical protein